MLRRRLRRLRPGAAGVPRQVPRPRRHPRRLDVPAAWRWSTPLFQLFTNIGWIGTYQALIIPDISFALPLTIYTLTAFFREMPWELEEAARIDGCTPGQAFRKVILPLAAPGLFTTAILAFIAAWNEFLLASQFSSDKTQPVTVAIANFTGAQPHQEPYTAVMAAGTIVTVPLMIMVLLFQRRIVSGLTAGGVKG